MTLPSISTPYELKVIYERNFVEHSVDCIETITLNGNNFFWELNDVGELNLIELGCFSNRGSLEVGGPVQVAPHAPLSAVLSLVERL